MANKDKPIQQAPVQGVDVEPANATVSVGATQQYTAIATFLGGGTQDVTAQSTWVVYPFELGTINAMGLLSATAVGTGSVYATYSGVQSGTEITISVVPDPVEQHRAVSPGGTCHLCGWTWTEANALSTGAPATHIVHVPAQ